MIGQWQLDCFSYKWGGTVWSVISFVGICVKLQDINIYLIDLRGWAKNGVN